ncbi:hypothetical protein Tco_0746892 [Tanacetum coccineum]
MAFPCLQELAAAQNSNSLTDSMSVYIERKINEDLHFIAELGHLWKVFIAMCQVLKQLSQTEVLKMLEIRKSIAEVHMQVHKKIDFLTVMRSFTLGFTEEADNVKILQSCNGLLLCGGLGMPVLITVGSRITFDPTKSPHYKLVDAGRSFCDIDIQIYSSETSKWSLCSDRFNYFSFDHFDSATYALTRNRE